MKFRSRSSIRLVVCFAAASLVAPAHGGSHTAPAVTSNAALGTAIVAGRPTAAGRSVVMIRTVGGGFCTGTVIDGGCVLTARHCLTKAGTYTIHTGKNAGPAVSRGTQWKSWGKEGDASTDVAVLKLDQPVPQSLGVARTELASTPIDFKGKELEQAQVIGYGHSGTEDFEDEDGKASRRDIGIGVKRTGFSTLLGYGGAHDAAGSFGRPVTSKGNILWAGRGPSLAAKGDSGGPLTYGRDAKIYGVLSETTGTQIRLPDEKRPQGYETGPLAEEATAARYASIPHNYKKIVDALDELKCQSATVEATFERMNAFLAKGERVSSIDEVSDDVRKAIEKEVSYLYAFPKDSTVELHPMKSAGGKVKFSATFTTAKGVSSEKIYGPVELKKQPESPKPITKPTPKPTPKPTTQPTPPSDDEFPRAQVPRGSGIDVRVINRGGRIEKWVNGKRVE